MYKKKICIITSSRADYDLLKPIMHKVQKDKSLKLICLVTGSHLLPKYGYTYKKIIRDGFRINNRIKILDRSDSEQAILSSISKGIKKFSKFFKNINLDAVMVLGDRFEILSAVICAGFYRIPIIHLFGGEVSEGAIDENIRHAISKFSSYHFVSNSLYRKRVIQLGENPNHVYNFGSTGPENIKIQKFYSLPDLEKKIKFKFRKKNFLITYHPVTYSADYGVKDFKILLNSISKFKDTGILFTISNADTKNNSITKLIKDFVKKNKNSKYFYSLGQKNYFSCIKYVDAVVGNSSSGLIEVPSLKKATINVGKRQKGRISADSVVHCEKITKKNITKSINKIFKISFQKKLLKIKNPYDNGMTSKKIVQQIKKIDFFQSNEKKFFDLKFNN